MDAIPARVLALGRSYATNDPVIHSVKYIAFAAAFPTSAPGPASSSVGWHLTPDEAYALHLSEFGFLNIFRLKEGSGNTFPDLDVSSLANDLLLVYGVPCAGAPASYRALLRSGITINSQEPCYAWVAPPGYSSLGDQTVVNRLAREGRLRPLVASDVPTLLSQWKYTTSSSLAVLSSELARFPSVGIVSEDGTGLDGWIMTRADGCLGTLHVMDSCRRMGYGQALVQQLLRYHEEAPLSLLCDGAGPRTPIAYTAWWNSVSIQLFSKLGFVQSGSVSWIYFNPRASKPDFPRLDLVPLTIKNTAPDAPIWKELVSLVNVAYRLGDKFFVDQVRTSESVVQSMAGKGVFWLAHSVVDRSLLACVYLSVCDGEESVGPVHSLECGIVEPAVVGRVGSIGMLTISPSLQKCGVGKQLLLYAEAEAAYAGCSETKVYVVSVKPWLNAWYEKEGYSKIGEEPWPTPHELKMPCHFNALTKPVVKPH